VLHGYVWYCIDNSCNNCGISRPTNGLCARCLDLPYCGICKRHLPVHCFDGGPRNICQVSYYFYTSPSRVFLYTDFTNWIIISIVTRCLVCVLQNCQKRRTVRRTALSNVVSETHLPVNQFDTSFETLINTRQQAIQHIAREAIQQHGYTNAFVLL